MWLYFVDPLQSKRFPYENIRSSTPLGTFGGEKSDEKRMFSQATQISMDRENNHTASKNKQSKLGREYFVENSGEYLSS